MKSIQATQGMKVIDNAALDRELHEVDLLRESTDADEEAIARLAGLSALEYDRVRDSEAKLLGVRTATLDKTVARKRGGGGEAEYEGVGRTFTLEVPEPWPEPVNGAEVLGALTNAVSRHIALSPVASNAIALWIMHAHAHDTASISPLLGITSPAPECGKTTLLSLLGALVPRPLEASSITAPALFRAIEKWRPTLLIDEADSFLGDKDELRGVLNSGHNRATAQVIRTVGDDHEPCAFTTWAPKAVALIGKLPATLASRSIHIEMKRMAPGERVEPLRSDRLGEFEPLKRKAWRWAQDNATTLQRADIETPAALRGRAADNWRHLVAVADAAGGEWPERARRAAETLSATGLKRTAAELLLQDVRAIFLARRVDRLPSSELAAALAAMEDRPWPEWKVGKPITPRQVARLLAGFGIAPKAIRMTAGIAKGYYCAQFKDAFERYLSEEPCPDQLHGYKPQKTAKSEFAARLEVDSPVTDRNGQDRPESALCNRATDGVPLSEGEEAYETDADLDAGENGCSERAPTSC